MADQSSDVPNGRAQVRRRLLRRQHPSGHLLMTGHLDLLSTGTDRFHRPYYLVSFWPDAAKNSEEIRRVVLQNAPVLETAGLELASDRG